VEGGEGSRRFFVEGGREGEGGGGGEEAREKEGAEGVLTLGSLGGLL